MIKTLPKAPDILRFECEHCHQPLAAPSTAAGQPVRCRQCLHTMNVPVSAASMEEEASSWIEQDLEEMWDELEQLQEAQAPIKSQATGPDKPFNFPSYGRRATDVPTGPKKRPESPIGDQKKPDPQPEPKRAATKYADTMASHNRLVPIFN